MSAILIAGYKTTDLGIFSEKDPKVKLIKQAIRKDLISFLEEGVDWFVFQGNLGFEAWCLEIARDLQALYPLQLATLFPFADYGQQWSEANQAVLAQFRQVDYVNHSFQRYEQPRQLRDYQEFLIKNTQGIYLFYDDDCPTRLSYLDKRVREESDFWVKRLTFERLNELAQDMAEN